MIRESKVKPEARKFSYKEANFRIITSAFEAATSEIIRQRMILEKYIESNPLFLDALSPLKDIGPHPPEIVKRMHNASLLAGVGPMASVAGAGAQMAAEAAIAAGACEAVVENGGDIYLVTHNSGRETAIALYAGTSPLSGRIAALIKPEDTPLSICSSSSMMGHTASFGSCDLATVVSADAALADAAATLACNLVREESDIEHALGKVVSIKGVQGILIIKGAKTGIAGRFPEIVKNLDPETGGKITKDISWMRNKPC